MRQSILDGAFEREAWTVPVGDDEPETCDNCGAEVMDPLGVSTDHEEDCPLYPQEG